jgi:hypothetical protein
VVLTGFGGTLLGMFEATISGLRVYPVKSLGGVELSESAVEKRGLKHDRRWMLVDEDGVFLSQRSDPRLALFRVEIAETGLRLSSPFGDPLLVPYEPSGSMRMVKVWRTDCESVQVCADLDEWFSDHLERSCSLVYMPDSSKRATNPEYTLDGDIVGFADAYPILVIGESSLADLNEKLKTPLPMNRFRPNIIVRESGAFAEDDWRSLSIGDLKLRYAKNCGRCSITTIDQETGEAGVEPLRTLAGYRLSAQSVQFGAYFVPEDEGWIRVGQPMQCGGRG